MSSGGSDPTIKTQSYGPPPTFQKHIPLPKVDMNQRWCQDTDAAQFSTQKGHLVE